jgi:FkbM family methyltransferase
MLFTISHLVKYWGVNPSGVLHVGAHEAEERDLYKQVGWRGPFVWVEAQSSKVSFLREHLPPADFVIHGAAWCTSGEEIELKITNNSQSSSVLDLKDHGFLYPNVAVTEMEVVRTIRLDDAVLYDLSIDFLVLDIQGAELQALRGAPKLLQSIKWIYTEVSKIELYSGCCLVGELDTFLNSFGFVRVQTRWVRRKGWGDALYIKRDLVPGLNIRYWMARKVYALEYELRQYVNLVPWVPRQVRESIKSWLT